ncbi:MAG: L,D-transpeptidase Cds6 family protein, partial [Burkholderiales bacterium]
SYAIAHENLGDVYAKMASEAYDKALQLDRSNKTAQTKLSLIRELFSGSSLAPAARASTGQVAQAKPEPVAAPAPAQAAPAQPAPPAGASGDRTTEVMSAVNGWAKAWSDKDVKAYVSHYSPKFDPGGGQSRDAWAATRSDRITRPKSIEVVVQSPEVTFAEADTANVSFRQTYRSDVFTTTGNKTLTLVRSGGRWLIVKEQIDR